MVEVRAEGSLEEGIGVKSTFFHLPINDLGGNTQIFIVEAGTLQMQFCKSLKRVEN